MGPRVFESTGLPLHEDNQTIVKERIYLERTTRTSCTTIITTIDHALTRPWTVDRNILREHRAAWVESELPRGQQPCGHRPGGLFPERRRQADAGQGRTSRRPICSYFKPSQNEARHALTTNRIAATAAAYADRRLRRARHGGRHEISRFRKPMAQSRRGPAAIPGTRPSPWVSGSRRRSRRNIRRSSKRAWRTRPRRAGQQLPARSCVLDGMPRIMSLTAPMEILIQPAYTILIFQDAFPRRIDTDGRGWPTTRSRPSRAFPSAMDR